MKSILILFIGIILLGTVELNAQDDLTVSYDVKGVPDLLNICGHPDTATVLVKTSGLNTSIRSNVIANVTLAGGIRIVGLLPSLSTAGVTLQSGINTSNPQFVLPDLEPSGLNEAKITFLVKADCSINDSLAQNPNYDLKDTWGVSYDLANNTSHTVSTTLNSYRAALRIPKLLLDPKPVAQKVKTGDCTTRTTTVTNTSLGAYLLGINYSINAKPSLSYKAIRINGTDIAFTKTVDISGDTIVYMDIPGIYFVGNTLNGGASNADTIFDVNEVLTIEEDICIANCQSSFETVHTVNYGCFGESCSPVTQNATLQAGQGNVSVNFDTNTTATQQNVGYCKKGISAIKITNTGVSIDQGFADMRNIMAGIGLGNPVGLSADGYTITDVKIQGVTMLGANVVKSINNNPDFAVDPDGPNGLADLDGDGFFDDLPEGESIEIVVEYDFNCGNAGNIDLNNNCDTAFSTRLSAFLEFDNPCNEHIQTARTNYHTIMNQKVISENYVTPDVDAGTGDLFFISHQHDRRVFNFDKGCTNGNFFVQIVLPQGVALDAANTTLIRSGILNHALVSSTMSNDTLLIKFNPGPIESLNGDYDLTLAFTADCSASDGESDYPFEFGFMCDDCNCKHIWHCENIAGTYIHLNNPPCPTAPTCDNAIKTNAMDMSRTTFGFIDSAYTNPIDPNLANRKSGLNCDTMLVTIEGLAGNAFAGNDIGIDMSYANPLYQDGLEDVFLYGRGYLEIKNGATTTTCQIPTTSLTTNPIGTYKYLDFSLLASLQSCGITVQPDDTVRAFLYFTVNDDGPFPNTFYLVPELRADFYVNNPDKITCGSYGDQIKVGKNRSLVSGPGTTDQPSGCDTTILDYKIIPINNAYFKANPTEHRPAVAIDSITFDYETPFLFNGFSELKVQASIIDHPIHGNSYFDIGSLDNSGHFVATFDTLTQFPSMLNINDYAIAIRFIAIPRCESNTGSLDGDNAYDFDANIYYKKNYHSFNISNGACVQDTVYNNPNDIVYSNPPEIGLENLGPPISKANGDVIEWTVRQCNTTNYADATVSWLSIEDITPAINILSIEDISDPLNVQNLVVNTIPLGGYIVNTDGLLRATASNTPNDICNIIKIKAQLTDCDSVSANIYTGWNCSAFDPLTHPFCQKTTLPLKGTSIAPNISIIQVATPDSYPFCDTITGQIELKNTQLGRDYNMTVEFTLPTDLVMVPGSIEIAWPPSAGFLPLGVAPTYVNSTIYGDLYSFDPFVPYPYLQSNGLPQVSTTSITDSNSITIRYKLISDCGYTSGQSSRMNIYGEQFCGDPTDTLGFTTFPIFITGSEPDPANQIQLVPTIADTINGEFPVNVQITNIGDSITNPNDKIRVLLSTGLSYVPNSATASGWTPGEPSVMINNGITTLEWNLPQGMTNGMANSLDFMLSSVDIGCGSADFEVGFMAIREDLQYCATNNSNCTVDIITSDMQVLDRHKDGSPIVTIGSNVPDTLCAGQAIDLTANGSDDITWILQPSGDTLGVGNPFVLTPDLNLTGIIATATSDTCSISSDTMNIFVLDAPSISLPQDTAINQGDTIQINGVLTTNIPTTFQWLPTTFLSDTTITNPLAFPPDSMLYILQATGNTGCVATDSMYIFVTPKIDTVPCPIFNISEDNVNYLVVCGLDANFPLSIPFDSLSNYDITIDGAHANDLISANVDSLGAYALSGITNATGPYDITWDFKDSIYTSTVTDMNELLIQFAAWDSFGNWFFDANNEILWGGVSFYKYGNLTMNNGTDFNINVPYNSTFNYGQSTIPLSIGNHQIIVFDSINTCADTVNVNVSCEKFNPNTNSGGCFSESIYINQEMEFCIDTTTVPGTITSFTNICANIDTGAVEYILNDSSFCLEYKGLSLGNDSACVVICDNYGFCDTINFCTSVVPYTGFPTANDDSTCVYMNTPGIIDILANDTTWGGIDTIYFVNTPLSGELTLNPDYSVTYIPDNNVCERTESLQYIVCNNNGCDDAFLDICILCDDIVVFTAVSPNGDGVNDVFYIANIENYPNSVVEVYNRWGNRVFRGIGYVNTWDGYWNNNTIVPDGTYYYVIKLNDRAKRTFKGYLEIRR